MESQLTLLVTTKNSLNLYNTFIISLSKQLLIVNWQCGVILAQPDSVPSNLQRAQGNKLAHTIKINYSVNMKISIHMPLTFHVNSKDTYIFRICTPIYTFIQRSTIYIDYYSCKVVIKLYLVHKNYFTKFSRNKTLAEQCPIFMC